jgi:hypothetical protein
MWEKSRLRERQRMLAILFGFTLGLLLMYVAFWNSFPLGGRIVGVVILGLVCLKLVRLFLVVRRMRAERAPTGPLSYDERLKARSKLMTPKR